MYQYVVCWYIVLIAALVPVTLAGQEKDPTQQPEADSLGKILNNKAVWGKDFPKALASLPHWEAGGETDVHIFANQMAGRPPRAVDAHAEMITKINASIKEGFPMPKAAYAELLKAAEPDAVRELTAERIARFKDDQKPRVVISIPGAQFFAKGLDVAAVEGQLGSVKPVLRTLQTDGDRRPIVLTEYVYAKGAVIFATSDVTPEPEGNPKKKLIDRAILRVPDITKEIFERKPQ
jgi:hypothetical protein